MSRFRALLAVLTFAGAARADSRCALVLLAPPVADAAAIARAGEAAAGRCRIDPTMPAPLQGFDRPPPAEARADEALARAHARMRRFDLEGVRRGLADAWSALADLPPPRGGRERLVRWALQRAEAAIIEHDEAAERRALRLALSVDPDLELDGARAAPTLVTQAAAAREERARAPRRTVRVETRPAGARLWASGVEDGRLVTPASLELPAGPEVLWLELPGHHGRLIELAVGPATVEVTAALAPLSPEERLRPLVEAVRAASPAERPAAAAALAAVLGVGALVLVEADGSSSLSRAPDTEARMAPATSEPSSGAEPVAPPVPPPRPAQRSWYRMAWPWVVLVAGAAVIGTAVTLGVVYGQPQPASLSCCR